MTILGKSYSFTIVAEVAALDVPIPFANYLKPDTTDQYYTLREVDGNSLSGTLLDIKKSIPENTGTEEAPIYGKQYFIYSDEDMTVDHLLGLLQMGTDLGIEVYVLNHHQTSAELAGTRDIEQIAVWQ
jgi:hypothetical protein